MRQYIGLIRKDVSSDYGVSFPDFPGCVTAGRTLDEARVMAEDALALHVEGMVADGEVIPEASSLEEVMSDAENRDGVAILVTAASPVAKTMRVNITVPEDVLNAIDHYSENHGLTRSGFLVKAAKSSMKKTTRSEFSAKAVKGSMKERTLDGALLSRKGQSSRSLTGGKRK